MPLKRVAIQNYKSIKRCELSVSNLNVLIGENGAGKTNVLEAIRYYYDNLTSTNLGEDVFDENNRFSNEVRISIEYDFSNFIKIAKYQLDNTKKEQGDKQSRQGYYKKILSMTKGDNIVSVGLTHIKGKGIVWDAEYEDRAVIKSLFPLYFIDARGINVSDWSCIWEYLGELSKVSYSDRKIIEKKLDEILLSDSNEIKNKVNRIKEVFDNSNVNVKRATSKEYAKNLSKVYLSGDSLMYNDKHISYYSTGTSSVKYIEVLLSTLKALSDIKLKEPIVLIDEPEISLHPQLVDYLSDTIIEASSSLLTILSSHSARLTKNVITDTGAANLYRVWKNNNYTGVTLMNKFPQYSPKSRYWVADDHINTYFAEALLFVEGESELEFFSNPYIKLLFPGLKKITVLKAMADNPVLEIVNPSSNRSNIPYVCLVDFDKAAEYMIDTNKFKLNQLMKAERKEKWRFVNKGQPEEYAYYQRKRIEAMADKLRVHYYSPFYSCNDPNYYLFLETIHKYLLTYNVYTFRTTLEGALINKNSFDITLEFIKERRPNNYGKFIQYWGTLKTLDRENALRLAFNGRSDLLSYKTVMKKIPKNHLDGINLISEGRKTSGWISDYVDFFFQKETKMSADKISKKTFLAYLENEDNRRNLTVAFRKTFPEVYSLIKKLYDNINEKL